MKTKQQTMKYSDVTPDELYYIINNLVSNKKFKSSLKGYDLSVNEIVEIIEDLFYELTEERGWSFEGMKKDEAYLFHQFLKFVIKTNVNLVMSK